MIDKKLSGLLQRTEGAMPRHLGRTSPTMPLFLSGRGVRGFYYLQPGMTPNSFYDKAAKFLDPTKELVSFSTADDEVWVMVVDIGWVFPDEWIEEERRQNLSVTLELRAAAVRTESGKCSIDHDGLVERGIAAASRLRLPRCLEAMGWRMTGPDDGVAVRQ